MFISRSVLLHWIFVLSVSCFSTAVFAKPVLVLFPVEVVESDAGLAGDFGSALQEGLQKRYKVFYGPAIEAELEKEYQKIDCNAERCVQNVAIAFNGELVGDASAKRLDSGYLLKLVISNVLTGEIIETKTYPCRSCDEFSVLEAMQRIGAGEQPIKLEKTPIPVSTNEQQVNETPVPKKNLLGKLNGLVFDTVKKTGQILQEQVKE